MTNEATLSLRDTQTRAGGKPSARRQLLSLEENWDAASQVVRRLTGDRSRLTVLEAGGGSATNLTFVDAEFTVVDISGEQLERNSYAAHKIQADLETFTDYPSVYDVIVCNDVLEHLNRPRSALERLAPRLAPGGLLVVGGPVPTSFKGLFTKATPHAVHVAFYRHLLGQPNAGKPGYAPFPAALRFAVGPEPLDRWAESAGLERVYAGLSRPSWVLERLALISPVLPALYNAFMATLRILSLGQWRPDLSDMVVVYRRG